jgi:hypothetical protein
MAEQVDMQQPDSNPINDQSQTVVQPKKESTPEPEPDSTQVDYRIEELRNQRLQLLGQVQDHIKKLEGEGNPIITEALKDFQSFFQDYTDYFFEETKQEAFSNQKITYARILATALENTRLAWSTLSLAINQRFNPVYIERLTQIDKLGKALLEKSRLLVTTDPIIYFDKIYHITRYPYQMHPLLGVPLDRFDGDDQSAIAHEIGHHIFWNKGELEEYTDRMQRLREGVASIIFQSDQLPLNRLDLEESEKNVKASFEKFHTWLDWREEVFADVVGTLLIGPRYAKSAQDILVQERLGERSNLVQHDHEHPMPALRPFLASTTLQIIASQSTDEFGKVLTEFAHKLEERWRPFWEAGVQFEAENPQESGQSVSP